MMMIREKGSKMVLSKEEIRFKTVNVILMIGYVFSALPLSGVFFFLMDKSISISNFVEFSVNQK